VLLKPKKSSQSQDGPSSGPSRLRLPTEEGLRPLSGIKELQTEALNKRGCAIELPWTTKKASQRFILTVQFTKTSMNGNWSLYEENEIESRVIWSQPWSPSDIELMYDLLAMCTDPDAPSAAKIPDDLKPQQEPPAQASAPEEKSRVAQSEAIATTSLQPQPPMPGQPYPQPQGMQLPYPYQQMPQGTYPVPMPYPIPGTPMPFPPQSPQPYPPQGYPQPPAYPPPQMPQAYPPPLPPGYAQGVASVSGWQYSAVLPQTIAPSINPALESSAAPPIDLELLEKQPNILLGTLMTDAGLITEATLEAALKLQELVRAGKIAITRAPEILKLFFSMGSAIEHYIDPSDFLVPSSPPNRQPGTTSKFPSGEPDDLRQALSLLVKAGLLTENDIETATKVRGRFGGDLRTILQSAGKLDSQLLAAAMTCAHLVRIQSMKVEQCVIALNYCSRSRVGFDEAMAELKWENPLKTSKNL